MVINDFILDKTRQFFIDASHYCETPEEMFELLISSGIISLPRCRIAVIKKLYAAELKKGTPKINARIKIGEKFCVSDKTIENIVLNNFYKAIEFAPHKV